MRKFMIIAALFAFGVAGAQEAAAQQNMVGLKAGLVAAELSGDVEDVSSRAGLGFGGFLQVMVGPNFSIQPEALYLMKGASGSDGAEDVDVKVNYLQVPILVQYHIPAAGVSPRIFAGPSLAFELGCDVETNGVESSCETEEISTKSADFGVVFGAGADIPLGGVVVTLDGRYDLGVTNVAEEPEGVEFEIKNRAWEFFAGVGFPFGP